MHDRIEPAAGGLTRRALLRAGVAAPAAGLLPVSVLTGCQPQPVANGFLFLRNADLAVLRALIPVVLDGALATEAVARGASIEATLLNLDSLMYRLGPPQQQLRELFDVLQSGPGRWLLTGIRRDWPQATSADIEAMLKRWHDSRISLFTAGFRALVRAISSSYYTTPGSRDACRYPGPPHAAFEALNA